jgi:RHS repeat-associated protein
VSDQNCLFDLLLTAPNIDQTFTYDGIGRLTASTGPWGNGTFQYDGLGNLRQRQVGSRIVALSYDANNRLTSHTDTAGSARSLTYDARGNVTALGGLGFTYDASDQPRTVTGTATGSYTYDGHMRRVKQVVGGVTRYSVYDAGGGLVAIDQTGVGGGNTEYIRASGMTLARIAGSTVTWLHHDHLGSAVAGTNSAGAVVWRESEQPFGEDWTTAAANDNQAGYTGHVEDAATGLTYMQARYYDPVIGRFLSIDPVGFSPMRPSMFNRYAYAANDPVNMWDPFGRDYRCTAGGVADGKIGPPKMDCSTIWDQEGGGGGSKKTSKDYEREAAGWRENLRTANQSSSQIAQQRDENIEPLLDELPIVGEAKSAVDVIQDPSLRTLAMALAGIVPFGKRGANELEIIAQNGTKITGFTKHGIDRVVGSPGTGRAGVTPRALLDALKNPKKVVDGLDQKGRPFQVFTGKDARVVVNPQSGKVVSVNPMSGAGAH